VIFAGIDEAGYGPRLGPLVVAANILRCARKPQGGEWPECRFLSGPGPVVVCDSKAAYSSAKGIAGLERAVLAFAACLGGCPSTMGEFFERWVVDGAAETLSRAWYGCAARALPQEIGAQEASEISARVGEALSADGFEWLGAELAVVDETRFNEVLERTGNKAVLLFGRNSILMRRLWDAYGKETIWLTADRHGGRKFYTGLLDIAFPEARIRIIHEDDDDSAYCLEDGEGRVMHVRFKVRSEEVDSAAALSSMWAKYTREILMRAFNDYWLSKADGLVRTAGYWVDAERFLADLLQAGVVTPAEASNFTRWK
jgi:hypothetical protein